jgi:hypothetical protein
VQGLFGNVDSEFTQQKTGHIRQAEMFAIHIGKHQAEHKTKSLEFGFSGDEAGFPGQRFYLYWIKK